MGAISSRDFSRPDMLKFNSKIFIFNFEFKGKGDL
jgi:hypothetical protein